VEAQSFQLPLAHPQEEVLQATEQNRKKAKQIYKDGMQKTLAYLKKPFSFIAHVLRTMLITYWQGTRTASRFCTQPPSKAHHHKGPTWSSSHSGNQTPGN